MAGFDGTKGFKRAPCLGISDRVKESYRRTARRLSELVFVLILHNTSTRLCGNDQERISSRKRKNIGQGALTGRFGRLHMCIMNISRL